MAFLGFYGFFSSTMSLSVIKVTIKPKNILNNEGDDTKLRKSRFWLKNKTDTIKRFDDQFNQEYTKANKERKETVVWTRIEMRQ